MDFRERILVTSVQSNTSEQTRLYFFVLYVPAILCLEDKQMDTDS